MAMAYEGADGNTAQEMSNALHILPDDNTRRENIASAIKSINKQDVKNMVTTNSYASDVFIGCDILNWHICL